MQEDSQPAIVDDVYVMVVKEIMCKQTRIDREIFFYKAQRTHDK